MPTNAEIAAAVEVELRAYNTKLQQELADLRARFEASQALANQALRELAAVTDERDAALYEITGLRRRLVELAAADPADEVGE